MGFLLMISGWAIVLAALALFNAPGQLVQRLVFVVIGIAVECLGLFVVANSYKSLQKRGARPR